MSIFTKRAAAGIAAIVVVAPALVFADTTDVQAQIQALLAQLQTLQQQLKTLMQSQTSTTRSTMGTFMSNMMQAASVSGTITANSGSSIVIQNSDNESITINLTASTTIQIWNGTSTPATAGTVSDLTVGKSARADGPKNSDGSIQAVHIMVGTTLPGKAAAACVAIRRNLRVGSQGDDVREIQQMLTDNNVGYAGGVTGYFGRLTAQAMAVFQENAGIASGSDGSVGPLTRAFFERRCGMPTGDDQNSTPNDNRDRTMVSSILPARENDNMRRDIGGAVSGTITANNGSYITLQNKSGIYVTVNLTASTTIQVWSGTSTPPTAGTVSNLTVGQNVAVDGSKASDGSISAVHIRVGALPQAGAIMGNMMDDMRGMMRDFLDKGDR